MAWSNPLAFTAVAGEIWHAADFNVYVRDNLLETMPAKATGPPGSVWRDRFQRTAMNTWGTADSGETYLYPGLGATVFNIPDPGVATVTTTTTGLSIANFDGGVGAFDFDLFCVIRLNGRRPAGTGEIAGLIGRASSDGVTARLSALIEWTNTVQLWMGDQTTANTYIYNTAINVTTDTRVAVRFLCQGSEIWAKAWDYDNNAEPVWNLYGTHTVSNINRHMGVLATAETISGPVTGSVEFNEVREDFTTNVFTTTSTNEIDESPFGAQVIDTNGRTIADLAFNPACVRSWTTTQNIPSGVETVVSMGTTLRCDLVGTSGLNIFTAQVTGTYEVGFYSWYADTSTAGRRETYIYVNGTTAAGSEFYYKKTWRQAGWQSNAPASGQSINQTVQLQAGDVIRFGEYQNSGVSIALGGTFHGSSRAWMIYLPEASPQQ